MMALLLQHSDGVAELRNDGAAITQRWWS